MAEMYCQRMKRLVRFRLLNKTLFLRYAMPCLMEQVRQGRLSAEEVLKLLKDFERGEEPDDEKITELFPVAMPKILALGIDKKKIKEERVQVDDELVRDYFWLEHIPVVLRKKEKPNKAECLILPGKVIEIDEEGKALVQTLFGERRVKAVLVKGLRPGDLVALHYDYACEKLTEEEFEFLKKALEKGLGAVDKSLLH